MKKERENPRKSARPVAHCARSVGGAAAGLRERDTVVFGTFQGETLSNRRVGRTVGLHLGFPDSKAPSECAFHETTL